MIPWFSLVRQHFILRLEEMLCLVMSFCLLFLFLACISCETFSGKCGWCQVGFRQSWVPGPHGIILSHPYQQPQGSSLFQLCILQSLTFTIIYRSRHSIVIEMSCYSSFKRKLHCDRVSQYVEVLSFNYTECKIQRLVHGNTY